MEETFQSNTLDWSSLVIYLSITKLQLKKANTCTCTSDKETSFLDLNIKIIGNDAHTSVYDKRD